MLLGGIPGVKRGKVLIIGGGTVGTNAAKMAIGLGALRNGLNTFNGKITYEAIKDSYNKVAP